MVQKENFSSRVNGSFAKEISLAQGKIPPNAVDLEKLVIGSFLIDKKGLDTSIELLKPEIFYDPRHQVIFEAIAQLYLKNEPVDMMMVINELRKEEKLSLAGGDQYIIDLSLSVSSSALIKIVPMYFNCWTRQSRSSLISLMEPSKRDLIRRGH